MTALQRCDVYLCVHPVEEPRGPSSGWYTTRESVFVRLEDSDGHQGWGEASLRPGVVAAAQELGGMALGSEPAQFGSLLERLRATLGDAWALSALSSALDDVRARGLGISVAELYGGRRRERVRAYFSSAGYHADIEIEELWPSEVDAALESGFTAYKFRLGRHSSQRELAVLRKIRSEVGFGVDLMADGNGAYSTPQAVQVARGLAELEFLWFEEPLVRFHHNSSYPGYRRFAPSLALAAAGGEGLERRSDFARLLDDEGVDIIQPDVSICGGIGEACFLAELAALRSRTCVPHVWGGAIVIAATLQALATFPEPTEVAGTCSPMLEWDGFENQMRTELLVDPIEVGGGWVEIPGGPGLGIEVDESFLRRFEHLAVK